nr:hypothetical protein [Candidatus Gracilibacteria bacterium]
MLRNGLTVKEHLDETRKNSKNGEKFVGVLEKLKDTVEMVIKQVEQERLVDRTGRIKIENAIPKSIGTINETINSIIDEVDNFKQTIITRMVKLGFGKKGLNGNYKITINGQKFDLPREFNRSLEIELNSFIKILKELSTNLNILLSTIESINNNKSEVENNINTIHSILKNINYLFSKLFLGERIDPNIFLVYYNGPVINKGAVKVSEYDEKKIFTKDFLGNNFYDINSGFYKKYDKIQDLLRNIRTNVGVISLKDFSEGLSKHLGYMFKVSFLRENEDLLQKLYYDLKKLIFGTEVLDFWINEYKKDERNNLLKLAKNTKLRRNQEALQPTLAIQRLTGEVVELIEQITQSGILPTEIEEVLKDKSDEVKLERQLKEKIQFASVDG